MELFSLHCNAISVSKSPFLLRPVILSSVSVLYKPQIQNSIICDGNHRIRSGSQRSRQYVLDSMSILASNRFNSSKQLNLFVRESGFCHHRASIFGNARPQKSVIYARKSRRRFGSQRATRFVLESMAMIVSKLNIFPEPLNMVIREFGGGNGGGGSSFLRGFGGGSFEGWRRRRKRKLGFIWVLIICCFIVVLCKEFECDLFWGILGFALINFSKLGFQDWVLGICCCLGLLDLGMKREKLGKWVEKFKVCCSPLMNALRRKRKKCRRAT